MERATRQKTAIASALKGTGRPMSPAEVLEAAREEVPSINLATVYRGLARLAERGEVAVVELPGEPPRYELREAAEHHHHHFRCDRCERVYDVPGCAHGLDAMLPKGFTARQHEVVFYGVCAPCQAVEPGPTARPKTRRRPAP